ncbi:hypothetical protein FHW04_003828 [Pantoea sp. AN62]|uniref:hypothetical protein n=1 Tax=Pantoea TaxID=53335 RepID=UPI000A25E2B5|nr:MULTISPECIES: hypothetical protein [Pantoea]MDU4747885.1 hypothetical protein [Pantoea sp.]HCR0227205.1 hypothetical protein [Enterobacter kobei]ORM54099.1 hypothetical protein HA39_17920 [Pantoea brenneri]OXM21240.1 hypothetical protein CBI35_17190 [Pantoea sp. AV62]HCR0505824.1 hypothetical protein [Enterobacter kobei]
MIILLGGLFTLLLANVTENWLPGQFISAMHEYSGTSAAADSGGFFRFFIAAVLLYVLSIASCGMTIALALWNVLRLILRLAGR